ncbi:DUF1521 domain-containing protein [Acanthopleuribacter pedis]|uniref:DUF1521 domain-containing protein n=1 Tax=Acanthopleuribacter pedis TaxID=442870 RepID=A0A8J7QCS1_9BACT|nr:DUF1521 domain-containing protein [Acanthopleuribacter pedis]MBO1323326.1 DUF1521 domain-containing protein [Acanthopleuribacter pedis]
MSGINPNAAPSQGIQASNGLFRQNGQTKTLQALYMQTMLQAQGLLDQGIAGQLESIDQQNKESQRHLDFMTRATQNKLDARSRTNEYNFHQSGDNQIYVDNDNYRITFNENRSEFRIEERQPNGEYQQITRVWGDPHVDEGGEHRSWMFVDNTTFELPSKTPGGEPLRITVDTIPHANTGETLSNDLTITQGDSAFLVKDLARGGDGMTIAQSNNGRELDATTADGQRVRWAGALHWVAEDGQSIDQRGHEERLEHGNHHSHTLDTEIDRTKQTEVTDADRQFLNSIGIDPADYDSDGNGNLSAEQWSAVHEAVEKKLEGMNSMSQTQMLKLNSLMTNRSNFSGLLTGALSKIDQDLRNIQQKF